jgi:hypothetical protein
MQARKQEMSDNTKTTAPKIVSLNDAQKQAFKEFIQSDKALVSAELARAMAIESLHKSGVTSSFVHSNLALIKGIYAQEGGFLPEDERAIYVTTREERKGWTKAQKAVFQRIDNLVNSRIKPLRDTLEDLEMKAGLTGQDVTKLVEENTAKAKASSGTTKRAKGKGEPRSLDKRILDEIATLRNALERDAVKDPVSDIKPQARVELLAAFNRIADILKK